MAITQIQRSILVLPGAGMITACATEPPRELVAARSSCATNEALSQARAQTVRDYLVQRGVPSDRIRAAGIGPQRPVADNATPEGRANNRCVEIVVQPSAVGGGPTAQ